MTIFEIINKYILSAAVMESMSSSIENSSRVSKHVLANSSRSFNSCSFSVDKQRNIISYKILVLVGVSVCACVCTHAAGGARGAGCARAGRGAASRRAPAPTLGARRGRARGASPGALHRGPRPLLRAPARYHLHYKTTEHTI